MEAIFTRRSIRKYKNQPVEKEKIDKLLKAAMQAPSAGNQQPWEFIVVQERENLVRLSEASPYSKPVKDAPLAFVLLGNVERMKFPENWQQDMGAATENILLQAVELKLGAVCIGIAPSEDRENFVKKMYSLPENIKPFCIIAIGYPAEGQENKFIDRYDEKRVHYEKF
ncbi:MAG: nitroreductase family protein [Clostridiaceae bacterium]